MKADIAGSPDLDEKQQGEKTHHPDAMDHMKEMDRLVRTIETAKRKGTLTLAVVLREISQSGWPMAIDDSLPTEKVAITLTSTIFREVKAGLQMRNTRVIRLGSAYEKALKHISPPAAQPPKAEDNNAGGQ